MQGTIHRLIRGKGFGFIQVEDRQFFFHHTEVRGLEFKELIPGDVVAFNHVEDEQGRNPRAVEVVVVEKKERPPRGTAGPAGESHGPAGGAPGEAAGSRGSPGSRAAGPGGRAASRNSARGPGGMARGPRSPRGGPVLSGRPGKPGFRRGRADAAPHQGFAPRVLQPGPADDGEFTEDLSATREFEAPAAPRRAREGRGPERTRDDPRSQRPRASGTPGERGEGVIRAMNAERGFGFIETPRGDIFFHRTSVRDGFEGLNVGARVSFVFGAGDRGSKAEDVVAV